MSEIHPTAIVGKKTELGNQVSIGPFVVIEDDVIIGDGSRIEAHAILKCGTRIGKNVTVAHGAVLGSPPQDLKFNDAKTTLEVGDNTVIREYCTLNRGTDAHWKTEVGSNCFIMSYVHIAHDCIVGNHVIIANAVNMAGHTEIGDFAGIGGLTAIHQFSKIGEHAFVGGGLKVNKDVPPYIKVMGEPIRYGGVNSIGLSRKGFSKEQIEQIKRVYRTLYQSGLPVRKALLELEALAEKESETVKIIEFIKKSQRGIVRA